MKVKTGKSRKNLFIFISLFIVALSIALIGFFIYKNTQQQSPEDSTQINLDPATDEQINTGNQTKSNSSTDTPPEPEDIPNSNKQKVEMRITALNQTDTQLQIRALISVLDSGGSCTITMSNSSGDIIKYTSEVQSQASISTCKGFDIPLSSLSKSLWNIKIEYSSDKYISSADKDYEVK